MTMLLSIYSIFNADEEDDIMSRCYQDVKNIEAMDANPTSKAARSIRNVQCCIHNENVKNIKAMDANPTRGG